MLGFARNSSASGQGELRVHRKRRWPGPAASYKSRMTSCRSGR